MSTNHNGFLHQIDRSALWTIIGVFFLFLTAIIVTMMAPSLVDPSWTSPTNAYQVQMYEVSDPNYYISSTASGERQAVTHLKKNYNLLAFKEDELLRILAKDELQKYVTHYGEDELKLTSNILFLRRPKEGSESYLQGEELKKKWVAEWKTAHPKAAEERILTPSITVLELYDPELSEAFAIANTDAILDDWIDQKYKIIDEKTAQPWHKDEGVIYVSNPVEFRVSFLASGAHKFWSYDPKGGKAISSLSELKSHPLGFHSRRELIYAGEEIYAREGCWYCHSDQTRTLVQDVVLNGSDSYPAPPSSANEYIYQKITFPGTRRIGPDISRVGIKRPSRDWHKSHFWSPKTESRGSVMPAFRHFFDNDPRGSSPIQIGIPNYQFEAIFQYLMTKGTRITPPTQAWWLGKDPVKTIEIIEGRKVLP